MARSSTTGEHDMSEWKGQVSKINSRDWGTKTLWSFQLKGANLWLRIEGNERPDFEIDQWICAKGETPNKITEIEIIEEEVVKEAVSTTTSNKLSSGEAPPTNSPDYWRWKQMHDLVREDAFLWRDARADAVRVITACLAHDQETEAAKDAVLSLGAKKAGRLDVLTGMINTLSEQFVIDMKERINESSE